MRGRQISLMQTNYSPLPLALMPAFMAHNSYLQITLRAREKCTTPYFGVVPPHFHTLVTSILIHFPRAVFFKSMPIRLPKYSYL